MHNLHFILINADSAIEAAGKGDCLILHWGDENNWRRIGGVASEDDSDDIENHDDGRWGLSFLDGISTDGTYFNWAMAYLHRQIAEPVIFPVTPRSTHSGLNPAILELSDQLRAFDPERGDTFELWCLGRNLEHVSELITTRRAREKGEEIPQFYDWQYDHFGFTDLTEQSEGPRRYLVFLDMHS